MLLNLAQFAFPSGLGADTLEPTTCSAESIIAMSLDAPKQLRDAVREVLARDATSLPECTDAPETIFVGTSDVDEDGTVEIFAYVKSSSYCGSRGCLLLVLRRNSDGGWVSILQAQSPDGDACIAEEQHKGFHDVHMTGESAKRLFVWDGGHYVELR